MFWMRLNDALGHIAKYFMRLVNSLLFVLTMEEDEIQIVRENRESPMHV